MDDQNSQDLELKSLREENARLKREMVALQNHYSIDYDTLRHEHQELSDSVNYAFRIQQAIQPPLSVVDELLENNFVLYLPKDVVSGDFYFIDEANDHVILAAVDCTGHGIPGALLSVIGFNYLDLAVAERKMTEPGKILSFLDEGVNRKLRQTANQSGVKDGMDLSLVSLTYLPNGQASVQYAGAYNSIYFLTKKGESFNYPIKAYSEAHDLYEIGADKFPIGVNLDGVTDTYTNHEVILDKGDTVYLFSDGYADQFGGPKGKKMKYKKLREILLEIQNLDMNNQKIILENRYRDWQGSEEQLDDVLVIGFKI
jgi:serine phosphatase RsbU (regulator of sigma subunit)